MATRILLTGAGGGFGGLTTLALARAGHELAVTMRDIHGRNRQAAEAYIGIGVHVIEMDVTQDASVQTAVAEAIEVLGGVDVVINNAGLGVLGVQEAFTAEDWQKVFDINVFGVQRVIRAVLPHMRERRSGLLMQISSLLGRIVVPFYGPYNASKWALEALSENYRVELSRFGIDVVVVEPGGYPTSFIDNLMRPGDQERSQSLSAMTEDAEGFLKGFEMALASNPAQNPDHVAEAIVRLIETPVGQRPFRTIVDQMGMGAAIQPYNDLFEQVSSGIYAAFGIGHLREIQKSSES